MIDTPSGVVATADAKRPHAAPQVCRVCSAPFAGETFTAREMMLGTRDRFEYWECSECGCVQILEVPDNLGDYYPQSYFSLKPYRRRLKTSLRSFFDRHRVHQAFGAKDWLGKLCNLFVKPLDYIEWCRFAQVGIDARVLDVGCGAGKLPLRMKIGGFEECVGVDPHIDADIQYPLGVRIYKKDIAELALERPGEFDFIMFHHSLEHVPDPRAALQAARRLLAPSGKVLIRIPVAGSYAWRRYGKHWVQLDPPRHLWLPTVDGMDRLARETGFSLSAKRCDSTSFQFIGSELYHRDIPLSAPRGKRNIFSGDVRRRFEKDTRRLNDQGDGDQAVIVLESA